MCDVHSSNFLFLHPFGPSLFLTLQRLSFRHPTILKLSVLYNVAALQNLEDQMLAKKKKKLNGQISQMSYSRGQKL